MGNLREQVGKPTIAPKIGSARTSSREREPKRKPNKRPIRQNNQPIRPHGFVIDRPCSAFSSSTWMRRMRFPQWVKSGGLDHLARASGVPSIADVVETVNHPDRGALSTHDKPARANTEAACGVLRCAQWSASA